MLLAGAAFVQWGGRWVAWELLGKIVIGVVVGWAIGQLLARLAFRAPNSVRFAATAEPCWVPVGCVPGLRCCGTGRGYGFAVFCAALAIRSWERGDGKYHRVLHEFIGQIERLLTLGLLLLLGYFAVDLLGALTWQAAVWGMWSPYSQSVLSRAGWRCSVRT